MIEKVESNLKFLNGMDLEIRLKCRGKDTTWNMLS